VVSTQRYECEIFFFFFFFYNKREGWIHSKLLSRASRKQLALKSLSSKLNPMIFKDRTSYVQIAVTLDELS
jgi:hypothetical protein